MPDGLLWCEANGGTRVCEAPDIKSLPTVFLRLRLPTRVTAGLPAYLKNACLAVSGQ
jgi:hypothetical protein